MCPILVLIESGFLAGEVKPLRSDSKGQPWPSQEQSQLLFGCFAALCSVVQSSELKSSVTRLRSLLIFCYLSPFLLHIQSFCLSE